MDSYYNPYERLNFYLSCLGSEYDEEMDDGDAAGYTISRLSEMTGIPLEIVRRDVVAMARYKRDYPLDIDYDNEAWESYCKTNHLPQDVTFEDSKEIAEAMLKGKMDDIPLYMYSNQLGIFLPLSVDELVALQILQKQRNAKYGKHLSDSFFIKNSYRFQTDINIIDRLKHILYAINYGLGIKTQYVSQDRKKSVIEFVPLKVMYDSLSSIYAALAVKDGHVQVYRIDRMQDKLTTFKAEINKDDLKYLEKADQVWGMGFSERPVKVKVAFKKEANVWHKVELETAYRKNAKITKDEEKGWLYFEDTVYGMSAFRGWLYGYGSSAVVLEPKKLREDIIAMLKERLENNKMDA